MPTFIGCSAVSVFCTMLICGYMLPPIAVQGHVDVDSGFQTFVVLPTLLAIPVSLVGVIAGMAVLWMPASRRNGPLVCAVVGQIITWALVAAIVVWAVAFPSTGWELITLPFAFIVGQTIVAIGLGLVVRRYRRTPRQTEQSHEIAD